MMGRNEGLSKKLRGKVVLVNLLADNYHGVWQDYDVSRFSTFMDRIVERLRCDASDSGVRLNLSTISYKIRLSAQITQADTMQYTQEIVQAFGCSDMPSLYARLRSEHGADEIAVIVVPNFFSRSFAMANNTLIPDNMPELATVYQTHDFEGAYTHETLHLFGAIDFYVLDEIRRAADYYLPNSIMYRGQRTDVIDDLTKYLIGWTDRLSSNARAFLDATKHLTYADFVRGIQTS